MSSLILSDCSFSELSSEQTRNLRSMLGDGAAWSLMVGLGEQYLAAFALALGMGEVVSGLIATMPLLAGACLQLVTPWAVRRLGSHRRWVVVCVAIQAAMFVPLVVAAAVGRIPVPLLFVIAAVYFGSGMASGPAWNTWVGTLVPSNVRAKFFSRRTRLIQAGLLFGFVCGGLALQAGSQWQRPLLAFAVIFTIAGACRVISAMFLAQQTEPTPPDASHRSVPLKELLHKLRHGRDGRLLVYLVLMQAAAQISGPFFTPFMLRQLEFSYFTFMLVVAVSLLAKTLALPLLGNWAQRYGARRLLTFGGLMVIPAPALWLVSDSVPWLLLIQINAGIAWAAYELGMFLLFFEHIEPEERTSMLTAYNLAHSTATVAGAGLGGLVLGYFGDTHAAYLVVFLLSGMARLLTAPLLLRLPHAESAQEDVIVLPDPPTLPLPSSTMTALAEPTQAAA